MAAVSYVVILSAIAFVAIVQANDLKVGYAQPHSRRVFSEVREANPAPWRRSDDVTIATSGDDVITAVYITDLREDKDGEAFIASGGVSLKTVTITLKSPTVFRGYKFQIDVFASTPGARYASKGGESAPYYDNGYPDTGYDKYDNSQYARKN